MASINSLGSSSSIYGSRNVMSGLASGMDTETLIENAVAGIQAKIAALQKKSTKVEWQQEAYRKIIDQILNFSSSYNSYSSSNNLSSASFFNSAYMVTTAGKYADKISATGKSSSDIRILGVKQLATSTKYSVSGVGGSTADVPTISGSELDLNEEMKVSKISGSLTINYGGSRAYTVKFGELDAYENADELADAITEQLKDQKMTLSDGSSVLVSSRIGVSVKDGNIEFYDKAGAGNKVYVHSASGDLAETLHVDPTQKSSSLEVGNTPLYETPTKGEYLKDKEIKFTLDGVTKTISIDKAYSDQDELIADINKKLSSAFGAGKISVSANYDKGLVFTTAKGSTMSIEGGKALGLSTDSELSYLDMSKKLGDIIKDGDWDSFAKAEATGKVTKVEATETDPAYYVDEKGNRVEQADDDNWYRIDEKGDFLYKFELNGQTIGNFSKNSQLENVTVAINNNTTAGVNVSYSKTTNQFHFVAEESGSAGKVDFGEGLAQKLFGQGGSNVVKEEQGVDAIFSMSVDGNVYDGISRSSNTFNVDGMDISLKGTFGEFNGEKLQDVAEAEKDAVTFTCSADADKIVDAIKTMVEDYNAMVTEIKNAYSTMPAQKSNGSRYEPLSDKDIEGMTESAVKSYEEKAKEGILFADRDLSNLYSKLTSIISPAGQDGADLRAMGLEVSYSNGLSVIKLDEDKLRATLNTNPDKVKDAFTKSVANGAETDGLMASLKNTLEVYAKSTGSDKGILVTKAGSAKVPASVYQNTLQTRLDEYDKQIEKWQDKLSDRVDYYTKQFTLLEQLVAEMNSQSSALMGLMGGMGTASV